MKNISHIIIHGNNAHADDVVGMMIAAYCTKAELVERRKPTEEEKQDPSVLIIDTGLSFDSSANNLDHHQDAKLPCAAHLVVEHIFGAQGIDLFSLAIPGFRTMDIIDREGPTKAAGKFGIDADSMNQLSSVVETALIGAISNMQSIKGPVLDFLKECGRTLVKRAEKYQQDLQEVKTLQVKSISGVRYIEVSSADNLAVFDHAKAMDIALIITPDRDSPDNLRLRRANEHPKIDLTKLNHSDVISFTNSGHFAVISKTAPLPALISKAVIANSRSLENKAT